jgi:hypothetical protein
LQSSIPFVYWEPGLDIDSIILAFVGVCYGHIAKVDVARGNGVAVGGRIISSRIVLNERSGKIQDVDAEDDGVQDGAGVAG